MFFDGLQHIKNYLVPKFILLTYFTNHYNTFAL